MGNQNRLFYTLIERIFFLCITFMCLVPSNVKLMGKSIYTLVLWPLYACIILRLLFITYRPVRITPSALLVLLGTVTPWLMIAASVMFLSGSDAKLYDVWRLDLAVPPACFLLCFFCARDEGFLNKLANMMIFITLVVLMVEAVEVITGKNPVSSLSMFDVGELGISDRGGAYRARSTFTHPLVLDQFFSLAAPFICYRHANSRGPLRWLLLAMIPMILMGGYFTVSRSSALIVLMAIILFYLMLRAASAILNRDYGQVVLLSCLGVITLLIAGPLAPTLFGQALKANSASELSSSNARETMHVNGLNYLLAEPMGYGYGQAENLVGQLTSGKNGTNDLTVDDYFLRIGLNSGLFVVLIMIGNALLLPFLTLQRNFLENSSPALAALVSSVAVAWVVSAFIQSNGDLHFLHYACAGIALSTLMVSRRGAGAAMPAMA